MQLDSVPIAENSEGIPQSSGAGIDTTSLEGNAVTTIRNSIIADNDGDIQCYVGDGTPTLLSEGYNFATDAACTPRPICPRPSRNYNPAAFYVVSYYPISSSSAALDSGDTTLDTDQLGVSRPLNIPSNPNSVDGDDRGAYEFSSPAAISLFTFTSLPPIASGWLVLGGVGIVVAGMLVLVKGRHR